MVLTTAMHGLLAQSTLLEAVGAIGIPAVGIVPSDKTHACLGGGLTDDMTDGEKAEKECGSGEVHIKRFIERMRVCCR